ncbi:MBL fold metallo-hydrolase [Ancylobacter lacus]|uniref:MBL fold metallo-hydrolase n=1 Tax=Ancylobacter lacus TaxID=2579970 RepID=UPI001BCE027B|nr:MBL fold metallo-hydrolase [Ancylobacter lacus]MBS7538567.1 MBL fold metallo-hydrolase [Ancylobacter lacus]
MAKIELGSTLRVLEPYPGILAFYDGRIPGVRAWSDAPNWLDDGAFALGCASYAVIDGEEALVYDTHISLAHATLIRRRLEAAGVTRIRVVLSHWHDDHVAGNEVFADCEIIAHRLTLEALLANRAAIESADPPIRPLVLPNRTFEGSLSLEVGRLAVELHPADIHSHDGVVLLVPAHDLLLAGDTLEEPITYVAEPERLEAHLADLARMAGLPFRRILPNHGAEAVIAAGGYGRELITATELYVRRLLLCRAEPDLATRTLRDFAPDIFALPGISYFEPYEAVHAGNVAKVLARAGTVSAA